MYLANLDNNKQIKLYFVLYLYIIQGVSKVRSDVLSAFISEITKTTFSKIKYVIPYPFYIEWTKY